jgi:N-acetylglucosaminyldiphosphoundecaprenol N-acetyl-beta-D-mannosaminyltransferase
MKFCNILRLKVNTLSFNDVIKKILNWTSMDTSKAIFLSNVHMCMEVHDKKKYRQIVNSSDLSLPDGRPIYWALKLMGNKNIDQIRGYDLTEKLCEVASQKSISVGFFGSTITNQAKIKKNLKLRFPNLKILYQDCPLHGEITEFDNKKHISDINKSKIKILFVGLGCPKQETWIMKHKQDLNCVIIGVGAVFDFLAKTKKNAPRLFQILGLEWLFRVCSEPKRLFKRYLLTNPRFLILIVNYFISQLFQKKNE